MITGWHRKNKGLYTSEVGTIKGSYGSWICEFSRPVQDSKGRVFTSISDSTLRSLMWKANSLHQGK